MLRRICGGWLLLALSSCSTQKFVEPAPERSCEFQRVIDETPDINIHTPRWAFEPWISKDISSTDDTYSFVAGFRERDIPVGVVVLDSPWETHYNTFVPNPTRYHDFDKLVGDLHQDDIRVVLWMTQMINRIGLDFEQGGDAYEGQSPNYQEASDCGFFVNEGQEYGWWKGVGSALDFFNPDARAWWHRQQDHLFDLPIDGYKLDFGDSYVSGDTVETHQGTVSHQAYSEAYYEDFFRYGAAKRGLKEFVTMVRPYDASYGFEGRFYARPEHAPVGWVGDNRRDWVGLIDALDHMFRSAAAGYVVIGSDIGGYLDRDDEDLTIEVPADTEVFDRWTALGALTPFMQLHGRANLAPWTVPDTPEQTVAIYRYWATLHHELVPFFYSLAEVAYGGGDNIMRPVGDEASWAGDYRYQLGDAFLVAPIMEASDVRDVALPAGVNWYDWWRPGQPAIAGGQVLSDYDAGARSRIPLFVREGAIVPMTIDSAVTGIGSEATADALTLLLYPSAKPSRFELRELDDSVTIIDMQQLDATTTITLSRWLQTTHLRVRRTSTPTSVEVGGSTLTDRGDRVALDASADGYVFDAELNQLWVKAALGVSGAVTIQ